MAGSPTDPAQSLPPSLALLFAPLHKVALGMAVGLVFGGFMALITAFHVILQPGHAPDLGLLTHYFYGYRVSAPGIAIGALWGAIAGFAMGWTAGFVRNATMTLWLLVVRTKADLAQPFLDQI